MAESNLLQRKFTAAIDSVSNSVKVIDVIHSEIHEGQVFSIYKKNAALAASSWLDIQINTATSHRVHLKEFYCQNSGGLAEIILYESPSTFTSGSSAMTTIFNRYRGSTYTLNASVYNDPANLVSSTATSTQATIVQNYYIGSTGTNVARVIGVINNDLEYNLNSNTTYVFRLHNASANAGFASIVLTFYEE